MKRPRPILPRYLCLFAFAITGYATLLCPAEGRAQETPAAVNDSQSEEQQAALKVLGRWFLRLNELHGKISDPTYHTMVRENIAAFKERHAALQKNFSQSTYEDLKFDIMIEHHRIARWLGHSAASEPKRGA
jgi:hypothetical protein